MKYNYLKDCREWELKHGKVKDLNPLPLPNWLRKKVGGKKNETSEDERGDNRMYG